MTALYDKLLNKIPISELVKVAGKMIFKCLLPKDLRRHLCRVILKTIPIGELRMILYPCLRNLGSEGELAIAKLEEMVTGRTGEVYKIASARFPEKFSAKATDAEQARALAEVTSMYCADPYMQTMLGRSPDDFNDELASWADQAASDAICDGILELYGPATEMIEQAKEVAEDVVDGMFSASKRKAYNLEREATLALDRMINPIKQYLASGNMMKDIGVAFVKGLQDMAMSLVYATVMIIIKYVKDEIIGSLTKDLCNSQGDVFNVTSPTDWLMNSQIYKDKDQQQLWDAMGDLSKNMFNADFQNIQWLKDGFGKIGDAYSPREMVRLFTTSCEDRSFVQQFSNCSSLFMTEALRNELNTKFPGATNGEIASKVGYDPARASQIYEIDEDGDTIDLSGFISPGEMHDFLNAVGKQIDPNIYVDVVKQYDAIADQFASFCEPGGLDELAKTIDPDDIKKLAEGDTQELLEDITKILPLLDENMMKNMYPPLFCGPCAPNQVGMEPIMSNQTHPSQLFMYERLNDHTYKIIDDVFNNNLSAYKPMINEVGDMSIINTLINELPKEIDPEKASAEYGKSFGAALKALGEDPLTKGGPNKIVAKKFRDVLIQVTDDMTSFGQMFKFDPENQTAVFLYQIPDTAVEIYLVINFSGFSYTFKEHNISSPQIKFISYNAGVLDHIFPEEDQPMEDFNTDDVVSEIWGYWLENYPNTLFTNWLQVSMYKNTVPFFEGIFPIVTNLILETIWKNTAYNDLFLSKNFNSLPLTNQEAESKCADTDITPLLDPEGIKKDIDEMRKSLECVTSMFAKPDALQIANLFGLYKALIKVCVTEELLKVLFMYSFARIHDIIENPEYMKLVTKNVKYSIESVMSTGYEEFKKYATKLINARTQLIDKSELEGKSKAEQAEITRVKTADECVNSIITECAIEVDKLFDTRIRYHIDDDWKKLFMSMDDIDPKKPETYFKNNFFQYAINSKLMVDSRYPTRKYVEGGETGPQATPFKLQHGGIPSFETVQYAKDAFKAYNEAEDFTNAQLSLLKPIPLDTGGGLYYEPYIRLKSTLALDDPKTTAYTYSLAPLKAEDKIEEIYDEDTDTTTEITKQVVEVLGSQEQHANFRIFWGKLKQAFNDWGNQTHRSINDDQWASENNYLGGEIFDHFNSEEGILSKDLFNSNTTLLQQESWPLGAGQAFYQGDNDAVHRAHNFLKSLITKIDQEEKDHNVLVFKTAGGSKSTFWQFFDLFFAPLSQTGIPYSVEEQKKYGMLSGGNNKIDHRSVFGNIVSSFRHHKDPDGVAGDQIKYGTPGVNSQDPGIATSAGELGWTDAFYYWQYYPEGVIPAAKVHFLNRGVINFSSLDTDNNLIWSNANFQGPDAKYLAHAVGDLSVADPSIINLYALSKNSTFGIGTTTKIQTGAPTWTDTTAEALAEAQQKAEDDPESDVPLPTPGQWHGSSLFNQYNENSMGFIYSIEEFMLKHDTKDICKLKPKEYGFGFGAAEAENARLRHNAYSVCSFYNWFKSTIIESRFDRWFEMSLGMRLNLVIPFEDPNNESKLSNTYLKNLIDTALDQPAGESTRRDYNLDKVFLLSEPPDADQNSNEKLRKWLCVPLEFVEYDLYDYWEEMYNLHKGTEQGKVYPGSSIVDAIKTDGKVPNNPWHTIMKDVIELGSGDLAKPTAAGWRHNFSRGSIPNIGNSHLKNFYKNMYTPIAIDQELMMSENSAVKADKYYVSNIDDFNFNVPTLWSACRLIQTALADKKRINNDTEEENDIRKKVLENLKSELLTKIKNNKESNKMLNELLPLKESIFTTAMMYRYSMISAYPPIVDMFSPTKNLINSFIAQMLKTIEGDYTYVNEALKEMSPAEQVGGSSPSPGDIAKQFFELIVQMAANTIDPTWKTPWFFPGPLTPIGAIAKGISMDWGQDDEKKTKDSLAGDKCEDEETEAVE